MPVYKLDLVFLGSGLGWRETYYRTFSGDFGSANTVATTLAQKRALLMGAPCQIEGYMLQDPLGSGRKGQSFYFKPPIESGEGQGSDGAAAPSACINIVGINNATNKVRRTQMRGVWDNAITFFGRLDTAEYANWYSLFLQYRNYLLQQQFGFMSRDQAATDFNVSYTYAGDDETPTFAHTTDFWPAELVGTLQSVRFSKFNGGKSVLNRELVVFVINRSSSRAAAPISAGPMISEGRMIRYAAPTFLVFDNLGVERVGRRAPGRPLLRTPGRARAKART